MKLITAEIQKKLQKNYEEQNDSDVVLKLFNPVGNQTWLITQMEPDNDIMWGLCDLGFGCAEYGTVSLSEIKSVRLPMGLSIERDISFKGGKLDNYRKLYDERGTLAGC
jgi:hypothetical protein